MESITIPEFTGFDWNKGNISKNRTAHNVTFQEAEQVFFNTPLIVADDLKHSETEKRYVALGQTDEKTYIFIVFTMRKQLLRVISARDMNRKERKVYMS